MAIVKNEAKFIEACLESVKPLISSWLIVDTGSTDGTQALIKKSLKKVKGELVERPFVDFGTNRTEALELARGTADWLLELDADMTVGVHEDLLKWLETDPDPSVDAWMVEIVDSGTVWRLPRLIRGDREWTLHRAGSRVPGHVAGEDTSSARIDSPPPRRQPAPRPKI